MGSGQKLFNTLVKAGVKAVKEAERERMTNAVKKEKQIFDERIEERRVFITSKLTTYH